MLTVLYFVLGLVLLYFGADSLVKGGASIALKLNVSPLVIGLTLVAYGTSAPEMVVSIDAALKGLGDVSIGNVVGSNICNIALILGLCAVITPLRVNPELLKFDIFVMIGSAGCLLGFFILNSGVNRVEGACLLLAAISYTLWSFYASRKGGMKEKEDDLPKVQYGILLSVIFVLGGLAALVGGAKLFVNSAVRIAEFCGVSEAVIGLTVVAIGTSLPELATSVVAAIKKEQDIAIGNVIGSNIFNVLAILGAAPLITPVRAEGISWGDMGLMLAISILLYPIMKSGLEINRKEGIFFLAVYGIYTVCLII